MEANPKQTSPRFLTWMGDRVRPFLAIAGYSSHLRARFRGHRQQHPVWIF